MKNVVYIVIDSFSKKVLDSYPFKEELFLTKLSKQSLTFDNIYTQGPFTEASVNAIVSGANGLDYGGNMYGYSRCPDNLFTIFEQKGYKSYVSFFEETYTKGFREDWYVPSLGELQYRRINDYKMLLEQKGRLSSEQLLFCKKYIQHYVCERIKYCEDFLSNDTSTCIQQSFLDRNQVVDLSNYYRDVLKKLEDNIFLCNVLSNGVGVIDKTIELFGPKNILLGKIYKDFYKCIKKHILIHSTKINKKQYVLDKLKKFLKNSTLLNFRIFINSLRPSLRSIKKTYKEMFTTNSIFKRKGFVSFHRRVDDCLGFVNSINSEDHFFIYLQPQDFHLVSTFHSYDSDDINLIKEELLGAANLIKRIPKCVKCNVMNFMSIQYLDKEIKRLYDYLKAKQLINNTIFVITGDHGSWNFQDHLKTDNSVYLDEERIHVPLIIHGDDVGCISSYYNLNFLYNIVLDAAFHDVPIYSALKKVEENDYLIAEYFKYGSPDPFLKPIEYVVHNGNYKFVVKAYAGKEITINDVESFYDLRKDKYEVHNLIADNKNVKEIKNILEVVKERHKYLSFTITSGVYEIPPQWDEIINKYLV